MTNKLKQYTVVFIVAHTISSAKVRAKNRRDALKRAIKLNKKKLKEGWGHTIEAKVWKDNKMAIYYAKLGKRGGIEKIW